MVSSLWFAMGRHVTGRRQPTRCMLLLRNDCGGPSRAEQTASLPFGNCSEQWLARSLFSLLLYCYRLVGLPFCRFQTLDQNLRASDHGAHRPDRARPGRGTHTVDEKM